MKRAGLAAALLSAAALPLAPAAAQSGAPTGAEITGQTVRVDVGGTTNNVTFGPGGAAQIADASGQVVQGNWFVQNNTLCLASGTTRECWPYRAAFQAGQPVSLVSDCGATSTWTPAATNPVEAPPPPRTGERG